MILYTRSTKKEKYLHTNISNYNLLNAHSSKKQDPYITFNEYVNKLVHTGSCPHENLSTQ